MNNNFNFGTFEGFNFKHQSAICERLTAYDVINWDHDGKGEAEFWPAGDRPELAHIFGNGTVSGSDLAELVSVIAKVGDDSKETLLRIYYATRINGANLGDLSANELSDLNVDIFTASNFTDARREAAYQLFELYFPEEYAVWEKSQCDGLIFDCDRFLDSPSFAVEELKFGDEAVLLISPQ